jgi:HPr kinase/phosphorylase
VSVPDPLLIHASCVAVGGQGLLILGPSGSGKSSLALQLMALGATLVADDRVILDLDEGVLLARCPGTLSGLIEARGVGVLKAAPLSQAPVRLAVDLAVARGPRLPDRHAIVFLGQSVDLVKAPLEAHLPAALLQYLRAGRAD